MDKKLGEIIQEITRGLPILLSMAADLVGESEDERFSISEDEISDWKEEYDERAIAEYLLGRIIDKLPRDLLKQIIEFGMILRIFNIDIMRSILETEFEGKEVDWIGVFDTVKRYSFVERKGKFWKFHDLIRNLQIKRIMEEYPSKCIDLNDKAFDYFSRLVEDSVDEREQLIYLLEALYHSFQVSEDVGLEFWDKCEKQVKFDWDFELWRSLLDELAKDEYLDFARTKAKREYSEGLYFYRRGEWDKASSSFEEGVKLAKSIKNGKEDLTALLLGLGSVHLAKGQWNEASKYCEQAFELVAELENEDLLATSYNDLGDIQRAKGNWHKALEYYRLALTIREDLDDKYYQAIIHNNLGHTYQLLGEWDQTDFHLNESLKIRQELNDRIGLAATYNSMGNIHQLRGQLLIGRQI